MSLDFAAQLANFAADELVSTRKELREVNDRHEKLYNDYENLKYDHENLKAAMLEMEKKMQQILAAQDKQLREANARWA